MTKIDRESFARLSAAEAEVTSLKTKLDKAVEALKPFANMARAMYVSGHCGGASPEDWPSRWTITCEGFDGKSFHSPQQFGGVLTVADFRRTDETLSQLKQDKSHERD